MRFRRLYEASRCNTDTEIVGLCAYHLIENKGYDSVTHDDLFDALSNSNIDLNAFPDQSEIGSPRAYQVSGPVQNAARRGWLVDRPGHYLLSEEGRTYFENAIQSPLPDENAPTGRFIDIDATDEFFEDVIEETNLCYNVGAYSATLVMYRKFLENILIHLLRTRYGMQNIEKFYVEESSSYKRFSELISQFESDIDDFRPYSGRLQHGEADDLVQQLKYFQQRGNPSAHSIDHTITVEEMEQRAVKATKLASDLLQLKQSLEK